MTFDKIMNKSIKILLVCVMVVSITIITLFVAPPSYALSPTDPSLIVPSITPDSNTYIDGASTVKWRDRYYYFTYKYNENDPVYYFIVPSTKKGYLVIDSNYEYDEYICYINTVGVAAFQTLSNFDQQYDNLLYREVTGFDSYYGYNEIYCPTYESFGEGINAISQYIEDNQPTQSFQRTITIKPGYVAYIQTDGGTLDLVAQFHEYSRFSRPLWDNGVRISFDGATVPTSGTIFNENFGSSVDWLKVASAPSNLLGQTMTGGRIYNAGLPEAGSNKCVVIYNPAYGNADTIVGGGTIDLGVYLTATFSNLVDVTQYKIKADATVTYSSGASITSGSPDDYTLPYVYIPSENDPSDVVTDTDYRQLDITNNTSGPAIDMNAGGYNGTSDYDSESPNEAENGILGLLSRILKFLSAPVSHIMSLFNAGGNFMAWLGQLWTWLPSDVGAILVDALIVLIVIGAIKFLWK